MGYEVVGDRELFEEPEDSLGLGVLGNELAGSADWSMLVLYIQVVKCGCIVCHCDGRFCRCSFLDWTKSLGTRN